MLLSRANADIQTAKLLLSPVGNPTNDEQMTDLAAYHTQQGIEKVLKYVLRDGLEINDTRREYKTHNLFFLIDRVERESSLILKRQPCSIINYYDIKENFYHSF